MTDVNEAEEWARGLDELADRLAPRFGRVEPRRRALAYLRGLLAPVGRKNGWQLAEAAGDRTRDGMQVFLGRMRWDADAVRWPTPTSPRSAKWRSGGEPPLDLAADLLPLTVPEVRRLLWRLLWARSPDPEAVLDWSRWRRAPPPGGRSSPGGAGAPPTSSAPAAATGDAGPAPVNLGCSTSTPPDI